MNAILRLSLPLTLWLAAFSAIYGLHGLLCSSRWTVFESDLPGRALLVAATVVALTLQILLLVLLKSSRWPHPSDAIHRVSITLSAAALASTVWTVVPTLAVSHCL